MVNRSMHESDSGAGQESWRDADTGPLLHSDDSARAAAAARREVSKELAEAIPALRSLSRQGPVMPTATQWSAFTRELSEKLDQETKTSTWSRWRASFHDRLAATDSKAVKVALVTLMAAAVAAVLAALLWIASQFAPVPAPAAAMEVPSRPPVVARA